MDNGVIAEEIKTIALKYYNELAKKIEVEGVYLFGSYSKRTFNDFSDIDVLIVSSDFKGDPVEDTVLLMKARRNIDRRIEPHPVKKEDFNDDNPFIKTIKKDLVKIA